MESLVAVRSDECEFSGGVAAFPHSYLFSKSTAWQAPLPPRAHRYRRDSLLHPFASLPQCDRRRRDHFRHYEQAPLCRRQRSDRRRHRRNSPRCDTPVSAEKNVTSLRSTTGHFDFCTLDTAMGNLAIRVDSSDAFPKVDKPNRPPAGGGEKDRVTRRPHSRLESCHVVRQSSHPHSPFARP